MPDPIDTTKLPDPQAMVDDALSAKPSVPTPTTPVTPPPGDETPLAFSAPSAPPVPTPPVDTAPEPSLAPPPVEPPTTTPPVMPDLTPPPSSEMPSALPPVAPAPVQVEDKPKKKSKVMMVVLGIFALLGGLGATGYYAYQKSGNPINIANIYTTKWIRENGNVIKNPAYDPNDVVNEQARNEDLGLNQDTTISNLGRAACTPDNHGTWCESVDSNGTAYSFCIDNRISKGCNQYASEKGYVIKTGDLKCISSGGTWVADPSVTYLETENTHGKADADAACKLQADKNQTVGFGTGSYICKEGQKGTGGIVYSGGQCTELNGKIFTGNLGCFCGTVQVDKTTGHQSYTSTCGCNTTEESPSPSPSGSTSMSCTGLTRTPTTESPTIGQTLTFTCAGSITPSTAGTLSYKFRYNINSGANTTLANKTATTAELTIAACGTYSVECQACATIAGVLTCDPVWTGATQ